MIQFHRHATLSLLVLLLGAPALAPAGEATDQIKQTTDKILAIVQDPALKGPDKDAERQKLMKQAVDTRFDWAAMSRSALGKNWQGLTAAQRTEFTGLFSDLVEKTYMSKVESYSGEKIQYKGDKVDGTFGVADVVIVTSRGTDTPVSYRVQKKGAEWLVYDVTIEGVSLVNNYRSQIGAILSGSSYDVLIGRIKTKLAASAPEPVKTKSGPTPSQPAKDAL